MARFELKVFIATREARCCDCSEELGRQAWICLLQDRGALCLACADLDHLVFVPAGDAALSRRARAASALSAVVLKWSKSRKHYERQGLLVESKALEQAEDSCLADSDARGRRREREAERRLVEDEQFLARFAARVRELYPRAPVGREHEVAAHACLKYSGRVGRSASAKALEVDAVRLAVQAHVRHRETAYDGLLATGIERQEARRAVQATVAQLLDDWSKP